jgi:DNA-binding GntR family transcriptional regulator
MSQPLRIDLDRSSPVPLYYQVATAVDAAITSGQLQPGEFLENEVALATRLGISRPTARQALQDLVDRGRLMRKRGVGTQVAPARIHRPVELTSLFDDLAKDGRRPTTQLLAWEIKPAAQDIARALEIPEGADVAHIRRLRLADGEPLAVMSNYVPQAFAPNADELSAGGFYDALRAHGAVPKVAHQRIGARIATSAEAKMLDEPPRAALLTMERTAYNDAGAAIEFGRHIYRASRYMFDTTLFSG